MDSSPHTISPEAILNATPIAQVKTNEVQEKKVQDPSPTTPETGTKETKEFKKTSRTFTGEIDEEGDLIEEI
jgi:hypothetical protein